MRKPAKRIDRFFQHLFSTESDLLSNPLSGGRCVEYAFVVENIKDLDRKSKILDVEYTGSPLTTIINSLGFREVTGTDILKFPVKYKDIHFICEDICNPKLPEAFYDVIIFRSTIEHIGLAGRHGASEIPHGDIIAVKNAKKLLKKNGKIVLTIPCGACATISPYHRVYNRDSVLMSYIFKEFDIVKQEYYKNSPDNIWELCSENEAPKVIPVETNYGLGLLVLEMREGKRGLKED